jgi:DNA-directed RNA polymerase subunit omega
MVYPNISELNKKAENKYALTSLIAKRTRDIMAGMPILTNLDTHIPMFAAEDEVYMDYVEYATPEQMRAAKAAREAKEAKEAKEASEASGAGKASDAGGADEASDASAADIEAEA